MIGAGMVSATYVEALAGLGDRIYLRGVLSSRQETAAAFVASHYATTDPKPMIYPDVQAIADDPAVSFVLLITPPDARQSQVSVLGAAGKPILMEKPVERTLSAAARLCQQCERHAVPLGIMLQHRARPSAQALRELIADGKTGDLKTVELYVPWWREQAYYDQPGRGTYARDGGGVMISQAIHTLDLALQFTGAVNHVTAMTATSGFHTMEAEDFVAAGLEFSNGALGSLFCTTASFPGRTEEILLHYENVSATLKSSQLTLHWQDGHSETIGETSATGAGADPMAFTADWHRSMIENFIKAIAGEAELMASGRSALTVHALIDALQRAGESGQRTQVTTQQI